MAKARITIIFQREYEINPEYYPKEADTDEKRLKYDVDGADEDPFTILEGDGEWKVLGKLVEND